MQDFDELEDMVAADPSLSNILQYVQQDFASYPEFSMVEGHLYYQGKLAIPAESPYVPILLQEFHNTAIGKTPGLEAHIIS